MGISMAIHVDPACTNDELRAELYEGSVVVLTLLPSVSALVGHTRSALTDLFGGRDPEYAHEHYSPAEVASLLGAWKPRYIHSDEAAELVKRIVAEAGFDPGRTHLDLPKPRTAFPLGRLNTGVAFAFPWHRDVWYSAPSQQLNWWLPIYPVRADNAMTFDLAHFGRVVPNDSQRFDYYAHNAARNDVAKQVTAEVLARPKALRPTGAETTVLLPAPGSLILFSGAQLHASIPNTSGRTRYSVDFRTVDVGDLELGRGAPMVDVACTGTAIRDFRNVEDDTAVDERLVVRIFGAPPDGATMRYEPAR
jgi:hypothetical protein